MGLFTSKPKYKPREPEHHCATYIFTYLNFPLGGCIVWLNGQRYPDDKTQFRRFGEAVCLWANKRYGEKLKKMDGYFAMCPGYSRFGVLPENLERLEGIATYNTEEIGRILYEAFGIHHAEINYSDTGVLVIIEGVSHAICNQDNQRHPDK